MGTQTQAQRALQRAEDVLARLDDEERIASAFGYNEAQFRFHEGNTYTHLHDTAAAGSAQDRALSLYPQSDFLDRALIHLDRSSCLAYEGDVSEASLLAARTLEALSQAQRAGLVDARAREIFEAIPAKQRQLPAVSDFRDCLKLNSSPG